jgi:hypothetical protein
LWYDCLSCARATRALLVRLGCLKTHFEGVLPGPERETRKLVIR